MAFENRGSMLPGIVASADLSGNQFYLVTIDTSGEAALAGDGAMVAGVLGNKPEAGEACEIYGPGSVAKVSCGAGVTAGDAVASDTNGQGVTAASTDFIIGHAITGSSNADEIISVWLNFPGVQA